MRGIWTDENKLRIWLQIELLAGEALAAEGVVPAEDFKRMKAGGEAWLADLKGLVERQKELEKTLNHNVIAFTTAIAEKINGPSSRWFHFGLTSSNVTDTAFAVQMVQSADILIRDVSELRTVIARRAKEHQFTPCIGRSHGIHAEPTTFGLKLALMHDEFGRAQERLAAARRSAAVGKLSGAVGTSAHVSPAVEETVCERLGLRAAPIATQVIQRDIHAEYINALALTGASIERWAVEFRHLQRTEVLETEEPFSKGQKGSSAAAFLALGGWFLRLQHLRALEMWKLDRPACDVRAGQRQGVHVIRVNVPLNHLRRDRCGAQTEALAHGFLDGGRHVGAGADGAGEFSHRGRSARRRQRSCAQPTGRPSAPA